MKYNQPQLCKLSKLIDGDTIKVLTIPDNDEVVLRLNSIDAPEMNQQAGWEAKYNLFKLLKKTDLEFYTVAKGQGSRGRIISDIYPTLDSAQNERVIDSFNYKMARDGYAWHYDLHGKGSSLIKNAQEMAHSRNLGLWNRVSSRPTHPATWRNSKSKMNIFAQKKEDQRKLMYSSSNGISMKELANPKIEYSAKNHIDNNGVIEAQIPVKMSFKGNDDLIRKNELDLQEKINKIAKKREENARKQIIYKNSLVSNSSTEVNDFIKTNMEEIMGLKDSAITKRGKKATKENLTVSIKNLNALKKDNSSDFDIEEENFFGNLDTDFQANTDFNVEEQPYKEFEFEDSASDLSYDSNELVFEREDELEMDGDFDMEGFLNTGSNQEIKNKEQEVPSVPNQEEPLPFTSLEEFEIEEFDNVSNEINDGNEPDFDYNMIPLDAYDDMGTDNEPDFDYLSYQETENPTKPVAEKPSKNRRNSGFKK